MLWKFLMAYCHICHQFWLEIKLRSHCWHRIKNIMLAHHYKSKVFIYTEKMFSRIINQLAIPIRYHFLIKTFYVLATPHIILLKIEYEFLDLEKFSLFRRIFLIWSVSLNINELYKMKTLKLILLIARCYILYW